MNFPDSPPDPRDPSAEAIRDSEENYHALFDANPLPSWVFDLSTLAFLEVNPAAVAHYGYSREEFLAMTIIDIRPPEAVPILLAELPGPGAPPVHLRYRLHRKKDGSLIEVEIGGSQVNFLGRPARLTVVNDVTERRRTEHALRESEARFAGAFARSPIATALVSPDGRWLRTNAALCELVGYSEDELQQRSFRDITHPDDRGLGQDEIRRMAAGEIPGFQLEKRYIHADGHVIDISLNSTLLRDEAGNPRHCVTQIQDVSQRKHAEAELLWKTAFLEALVNSSPDAVIVVDHAGALLLQNQRFTNLWQLPPHLADASVFTSQERLKWVSGLTVDPAQFAAKFAEMRGHPDATSRDEFTLKSGIVLERYTAPVRGQDGTYYGRIWTYRDITERKRAAADRRAKDEAERSNREKSRFLSRMSHELRTPLNAILGFGQLLEFSQLNADDTVALSYIMKGGRHLLSLIDEVLDISRAEAGELRLAPCIVDAGAVAAECAGLITRLAAARGIRCSVEETAVPPLLWCDAQRLRQMLLNLLSNAIKYNRDGGTIEIGFEQMPGHRLRVNVTDSGVGISPEGQVRLFVPFERLTFESGEVEGTGLGLVVSQRVAKAMDGTIGVESTPGEGSTFWIELPIVPRDMAPEEGGRGGAEVVAAEASAGSRDSAGGSEDVADYGNHERGGCSTMPPFRRT